MSNPVSRLAEFLERRGWKLSTAESCTGGGIAALLTDMPGSSAWFERGFVTYSNESKIEMLGVSAEIISTHGAVSQQTALAMAEGSLKNSHADVAVSVTGVAGPSGGTADKPVGLVFTGYAFKNAGQTEVIKHNFNGDRSDIRKQTADAVIAHLIAQMEKNHE